MIRELKTYEISCDRCKDTEIYLSTDRYQLPYGWSMSKEEIEYSHGRYETINKHYCSQCTAIKLITQ